MSNVEQFADMARLHHLINERLGNLEHRPATTVLASVDAGGAVWNASNGAWVDPISQPAWSELRVLNTPNGSELYRCMANLSGVLEWALLA